MAMRRTGTGPRRLAQLIRRLRPDGNPLRRRADRVEAAVTAGLLAGLLAAVPLAALAAGGWEDAASLHTVRAQQAWRSVPAVLLHNAPQRAHPLSQGTVDPLVPVRWTAPDGTRRAGDVYAPAGARAGTTVTVWAGRGGRLVGEPLRKADVAPRVALAAGTAAMITAAVLLAGWLLARRALDRRRLAAWDVGWAETEPQWTGRP
jgi:hypothetical protein